ncbi:hypothetical protein [Streptomyces sp. NBC_01727]|uniref:hypothetical protein n=1 Tax=Streptomyces sp. NBC_01727 TaxID=2975924 RepID=UPI002E134FE3|nr:hypothetical protein OIE76_43615 [Streptomyces sp. NBC_01727]
MKRRTITLESRGDICSRSTCLGVGCLPYDPSQDPEMDFENALMNALESEEELVGSGTGADLGGYQL